jgi:hypothetical protein
MTAYDITLKDQAHERIDGADAYAQEGQLTTFFRTASARQVIDCWSVRLASFRTAEIMAVRRIEDPAELGGTPDPFSSEALASVASLRSA